MAPSERRAGVFTASTLDKSASRDRKPNHTIAVPVELRRETGYKDAQACIEDLKVNTGCDVTARLNRSAIYQFDLFGTGLALDKATREVNSWLSDAKKKPKAWAKVTPWDPNKWYYAEIKDMEKERKQQFKGPVPELLDDMDCPFKVLVEWPADLLENQWTPRDIFGFKIEGLNPIRMRNEVYMSLVSGIQSPWQVEIRGASLEQVSAAENEYRNLTQKVLTERLSVPHESTIILDKGVKDINIGFQPPPDWWPHRTNRVVPRLVWLLDEDSGASRQYGLDLSQMLKLKGSILQAFEKIRLSKGSYSMAIHYGCLAVKSEKVGGYAVNATVGIERFLKAVEYNDKCKVERWLVDDQLGRKLLSRLLGETHFLTICQPFGRQPRALEEIRPTFQGTWVFSNPENPDSISKNERFIVIQITWTFDDDDGGYEKLYAKFFGSSKPYPLDNMDTTLLELNKGKGWHFSLETMTQLPKAKVPALLSSFAAGVQMKRGYELLSKDVFAHWDHTPSIAKYLHNARLDKIYTFGVHNTSYQIEAVAMWHSRQASPSWGLTIRQAGWASQLAQLEQLPNGRKANWKDTMAAFFPEEGLTPSGGGGETHSGDDDLIDFCDYQIGAELLLERMMLLSEIVSSIHT